MVHQGVVVVGKELNSARPGRAKAGVHLGGQIWCLRDQKTCVRQLLADLVRQFQHHREVTPDLLAATAGEESDQPRIRIHAGACTEQLARGVVVGQLEQRMPNEVGVEAVLPEQIFLERQDDGQTVDSLGHFLQPAGAPGPDLRCDVVEHGDAATSGSLGKTQVESGIVDQDDQVGLELVQQAGHGSENAADEREVAQNLGESQKGEILGAKNGLHPLGPHPGAGDPDETQPGIAALHLAHEVAAVQIPGGFSRDDEDGTGHFKKLSSAAKSEV